MKIAKVFFSVPGKLPVPMKGVVNFGPFLPASMAHEFSPFIWVEVPLQRRVTAVVAVMPQKMGALYYSMQFLDFTNAENKGTLPDQLDYPANALLPEHGILDDDPPAWLRIALKQAQKYWEPLTSKLAASKTRRIAADVLALQKSDSAAAAEMASFQKRANEIFAQLEKRLGETASLDAFISQIGPWQARVEQLISLAKDIKSTTALRLEALQTQAKTHGKLSALETEQNQLAASIKQIDDNSSELKQLLSRIQSYVESSVCPLCGVDHHDKNFLTSEIRKKTEQDPASSSRERLR